MLALLLKGNVKMLLRGHVGITAQGKCKEDSQLEVMMALLPKGNVKMLLRGHVGINRSSQYDHVFKLLQNSSIDLLRVTGAEM